MKVAKILANHVFNDDGHTMRLIVKGGLHYIRGNSAPYFSITADLDEKSRSGIWREVGGGCMHDEILKHFPNFKPLVDLHLSDIDGSPMHAASNANYIAQGGCWLGNTFLHRGGPKYKVRATDEDNIAALARHLRITLDYATVLYRDHAIYRTAPSQYKAGEAAMQRFCDTIAPRWKTEADNAIDQFLLPIFGDVAAWEAKKVAA